MRKLNLFRRSMLMSIRLIVLAAAGVPMASADFPQFKISNPGVGNMTGGLGSSIAVDGTTMIVGAPYSNRADISEAGLARIYVRDAMDNWTLQAELIASDPAKCHHFGSAVAISGDTVIVGSTGRPDESTATYYAAYVFTRSGSTWTQQTKLVFSGDGYPDLSVAISGNTAVIGIDHDDTHGWQSGAAYIFTRSGSTWSQQAKLTASDGATDDYFGYSVAISADTVVVGAYKDDVTVSVGGYVEEEKDAGSAYVFVRNGSTWTQQAKLTASDAWYNSLFGSSVSISGDSVAIGAEYADANNTVADSGAAYVFTRSGMAWSQQAKLAASDAATPDFFGYSISISGNTVIAGAYQKNGVWPTTGAAYVFTRSGTAWSQQAILTAPDADFEDEFGSSVAISGDTVAIGAFGGWSEGYRNGSAYVFARSGSNWNRQAEIDGHADTAENDLFGDSVAISGDTAVVGAPKDGINGCVDGIDRYQSGAAYVFVRSGSNWLQQARLTGSDTWKGDHFGSSVAIDGDTMLVGAEGKNDRGAAYVFTRNGSTWTQQAKLTAPDPYGSDYFGHSVSISGNTAIVGAYNKYSGFVYIFTRDGSTWTQQAELSRTGMYDQFGWSVSISGDTAVIGARYANGRIIGQWYTSGGGRTYVYTRTGSEWAEQAQLIASDGAADDHFGHSVSIAGDTAVIGAADRDGATSDTGAAYVFTRTGSTWTQQAKLTASDAAANDHFGCSVSISGATALVGGYASNSNDSGAAYVFTRNGSAWTQQARLTSSKAATGDQFGCSVGFDSGRVIVGSPSDDDPESNSGSVYMFELCPSVSSLLINTGKASTTFRVVTLNNTCTNAPTQYMACELASFKNASWHPYSTAPSFTLGSNPGTKTVYFKVKNNYGESAAVSDNIGLIVKNSAGKTWTMFK